jgi:hypothetical protein
MVAVGMTYELFSGGTRYSKVRQAKIAQRQLNYGIDALKDGILLEVEQVYLQLMEAEKNILSQQKTVGQAEEAAFRMECLAAALHPAGQPIEEAWLADNLRRSWELRRHLPRGRHVRRCLIPYVRRAWSLRRWTESLGWLTRAFSRQPMAASWRLLGGK